MCLQKALQLGVRFCSWKSSGQLCVSHTKYTVHMILLSVSLSHFSCTFKRTFCPFTLLLHRSLTSPSTPSLYLFSPTAFSPLFLSQNILLINAWQLQGAVLLHFFHGNSLSVSADPISVLVATCSFSSTEHMHVLNRRNYYKIPEIESPS